MPQSALLTKALVESCIPVISATYDAMLSRGWLKRPDLHMVFLDPCAPYLGAEHVESFKYSIMYEHSFTDSREWEHPYDQIAREKAWATWRTGLPTRIIRECMPHLLIGGNTKYGGSVNVDGIIVAASGVQPWNDEGLSGVAAMILRGRCNEVMQSQVIPGENDFLGERRV